MEPPAPTTEITWLALPTRPANHGASTRGHGSRPRHGELAVVDDLVTLLIDVVVGCTISRAPAHS